MDILQRQYSYVERVKYQSILLEQSLNIVISKSIFPRYLIHFCGGCSTAFAKPTRLLPMSYTE